MRSNLNWATLLSVSRPAISSSLAFAFLFQGNASDHHKIVHKDDFSWGILQYHTAIANLISSSCKFPSPSLSANMKTYSTSSTDTSISNHPKTIGIHALMNAAWKFRIYIYIYNSRKKGSIFVEVAYSVHEYQSDVRKNMEKHCLSWT